MLFDQKWDFTLVFILKIANQTTWLKFLFEAIFYKIYFRVYIIYSTLKSQLYEAIIECDFKENDIREVIGQCVKHHNLGNIIISFRLNL